MTSDNMESIFAYDKLRLIRYLNVQKNIDLFEYKESLQAFSFPDLNYFNYSFHSQNTPFSIIDIQLIKDYFHQKSINKFKLITDKPLPIEVSDEFIQVATFVKHEYRRKPEFPLKGLNQIVFEPVTEHTIEQFTITYLRSFESATENIKPVIRNFSQLLNLENLQLILMKVNEQAVGVLVLFNEGGKYLLAGGAVLPESRYRKYHKAGIQFRINQCLLDSSYQSIESFTYLGSKSMENMLAMGMEATTHFSIYEPKMRVRI